MEWINSMAGASPFDTDRSSPVVLRLLPYVQHPPCRVLVPGAGAGHEVRALMARGYVVVATDGAAYAGHRTDIPVEARDFLDGGWDGSFDMICERGLFATLSPAQRVRYVAAAAAALRPGGRLFGPFFGEGSAEGLSPIAAGALIALFAPSFDIERLEPSGFRVGDQALYEVVLVRR